MKMKLPKLKLPKSKWITIGILGVVLVGGGYWAYKSFSPKPATTTTITGKVQRGNVSKEITATGTVDFSKLVNLSFSQNGKLVALNVAVGDTVKAGQVLAQIDPASLQQAVNQQQAGLSSAQAKLQQLKDSALPNAQLALAQAQQGVSDAEDTLNKAQSGTAQSPQNGGQTVTVATAQANYNVALQKLKLAQSQVDTLNQGKSSDILSAQAAVQQAQAQLQTAQTNLDNATIVAPADGLVTAVNGQVGQTTGQSGQSGTSGTSGTSGSSGSSVITLAENSDILQIATAIGQSDIGNVKVGQKADITLDTQPNDHMSGTVSTVAVQGTSTQNVTTFAVTVTVDQGNTILKAGMNANVNIIVDQVKNVLTIPSEALRTRNGQSFVLVPNASGAAASNASGSNGNGSRGQRNNQGSGANNSSAAAMPANAQSVPVEIGLNDGSNVEIKSGLTEGQEIIVAIRAAVTSTSAKSSNPFGGGQGGANMGSFRATTGGGGNRPSGASGAGSARGN